MSSHSANLHGNSVPIWSTVLICSLLAACGSSQVVSVEPNSSDTTDQEVSLFTQLQRPTRPSQPIQPTICLNRPIRPIRPTLFGSASPGPVPPPPPQVCPPFGFVNTLEDVSDPDDLFCSLAEAITANNQNADFGGCTNPKGVIQFQAGLTGTIKLGSPLPIITAPLDINGLGANDLSISGGNTIRVFEIGAVNATINDLTITEGNAGAGKGGGILAAAGSTLTITHSVISNNKALLGGGGISSLGIVNLKRTTVKDNKATNGDGGGLEIKGGRIESSTISGNQTFTTGNSGGGIRVNNGTFELINSTISNNKAQGSGGGLSLASGATGTVINSTIAQNQSIKAGGGIRLSGTGTTLLIGNTIVSGNVGNPTNGNQVSNGATFTSLGNNIFGQGNATGLDGAIKISSDITPAGALNTIINVTLAGNGGPTQTFALVNPGPAVNAGDNALIPTGIITDQRGLPRPVGVVDIGSFEVQ